MRRKTSIIAVMVVLLLIAAGVVAQPAAAQGPWAGWPSADEKDGKFLNIAGPLADTPYFPNVFFVAVPSDATEFDVEVFDGDAGFFGTPGAT